MPQQPIGALRAELKAALQKLSGKTKIVVFGCNCAADVSSLAAPDVAVFSLICSGQLPPSFIEYAVRNGADGVFLTGCHEDDCEFRLGSKWTSQRLSGEREPHLRLDKIPAGRVRMMGAASRELASLAPALDAFRSELAQLAVEPVDQADDEPDVAGDEHD